jgi:hypothetical protein
VFFLIDKKTTNFFNSYKRDYKRNLPIHNNTETSAINNLNIISSDDDDDLNIYINSEENKKEISNELTLYLKEKRAIRTVSFF